ncbi:MAG: hypothetical protein ACXWQO_15930 [Bdellovibrionota bacterium]
MKTLLLLVMTFSLPALADEVPKGTVEVNPKVYSPKKFKKRKNITVQPMEKRVAHPDALPDKEHREAVFARVPGLAEHIEKLDELDRDMLYMRARNNTAAELKEKHPEIPAAILQKLQVEVKKP